MTNTAEHPEARTVSVEDAARILGIGRNLGYELVKSGEIPSLRLGGRIVVPKDALEQLLEGSAPVDQQVETV